MDFRETDEQVALREAVSKLAASFGHEYFVERAKLGQKSAELWQAVGRQGFLGVNIDEAHGGGGGGIYELQLVS